jgi:dUTP pyrophosphatase
VIKRGERIAQLVLSKVYLANLETNEELMETKRGEGGFGHTGKK